MHPNVLKIQNNCKIPMLLHLRTFHCIHVQGTLRLNTEILPLVKRTLVHINMCRIKSYVPANSALIDIPCQMHLYD